MVSTPTVLKRHRFSDARTGTSGRQWYHFIVSLTVFLLATSSIVAQEKITFEIKSFVIKGNTLLPDEKLQETIEDFTGTGKTAADVEKARARLEALYRAEGYGTVLVSIPQQSVDLGIVNLQVFEGRIGKVRITGNRYITRARILKDIPSLQPGNIPYIPDLQDELSRVNRDKDINVTPRLMPGKEPGTVDVELIVEDQLPLHGAVELNNRSTHETTDLRLNFKLEYNNLWQLGHTISAQYQASPEAPDEVFAITGLYLLNTPWNHNHIMWVYGLYSDSETAFGEGFKTIGNGYAVGFRYLFLLPSVLRYFHTTNIGIDYKDFEDTVPFGDEEIEIPVEYIPLSFNYNSSIPHAKGVTELALGLSVSPRELVAAGGKLEEKRIGAKGNYVKFTGALKRKQTLFSDFSLAFKIDGQASDQPLISNEQYAAGGMMSVRGYKENEIVGDDAIHGTVELFSPNLLKWIDSKEKFDFKLYGFYDAAALKTEEVESGQDKNATIHGTGAGVRGYITRYLEYRVDWGIALEETEKTEKYTDRFYFLIKGQF